MEMNRPKAPVSETLQTADLDNRGILQLQDQSMRQQDAELEELERTVTSTKVVLLPFLSSVLVLCNPSCHGPVHHPIFPFFPPWQSCLQQTLAQW